MQPNTESLEVPGPSMYLHLEINLPKCISLRSVLTLWLVSIQSTTWLP
jgi:hypothetical protein